MGTERRSEIVDEEIEDNGHVGDENDFLHPDEDWDEDDYDDEPEEREYCD